MSYDLTFRFTTDAPWRARAERIIKALQEVEAGLEISDGDEYIEVYSSEEGGLGLTFSFFAKDAGLSIPYWYEGEEALAALKQISVFLRIISEVGACEIYDRQRDEFITAATDYQINPDSFGAGTRHLQSLRSSQHISTVPASAAPSPGLTPAQVTDHLLGSRRTFWQRYRAALPFMIVLGCIKLAYHVYQQPAAVSPQPPSFYAPHDQRQLYELTDDGHQMTLSRVSPEQPTEHPAEQPSELSDLTWVIRSKGQLVEQRSAADHLSYSYDKLTPGTLYSAHLEAVVQGVRRPVSGTILFRPAKTMLNPVLNPMAQPGHTANPPAPAAAPSSP